MDEGHIKSQIGANIAERRKAAGMTQAELAEQLNYSDKAVSKWERGDSVPDVLTMMELARLFGTTVDSLLQDPSKVQIPKPEEKPRASRRVIQGLCITLVWFVALFFYVVLIPFHIPHRWVGFVYAVPVTGIVLLSLRSAWRMFSWNKALISLIVWGSLASIYVSAWIFAKTNLPQLFLLGIPGQAAVLLWFRMYGAPATNIQEEVPGDGE